MSVYLPYGGFKWLKTINKFDVSLVSKSSSIGYILEVDFKYPDQLHVLRIDYPSAPEKPAIPYDTLSDNSKKNLQTNMG